MILTLEKKSSLSSWCLEKKNVCETEAVREIANETSLLPLFPLPPPSRFHCFLCKGERRGQGQLSPQSPRRIPDDSNTVNPVFCIHRESGLGCNTQFQGQAASSCYSRQLGQVPLHESFTCKMGVRVPSP